MNPAAPFISIGVVGATLPTPAPRFYELRPTLPEGAGSLISALALVAAIFFAVKFGPKARAAARLRRQSELENRKLALVASRTDNAVILTDADGHIEWVNDGFTRMTEYFPAEVVGKKPEELLHGAETDSGAAEQLLEHRRAGRGYKTDLIHYSKSGRKIWVAIEVQPVRQPDGKISGFMSIENDITERKRVESCLRESEERFRLMVDGVTDYAIVLLDAQGRVASWNPGAQRILGYQTSEILGEHYSKFLPADDRAAKLSQDDLEKVARDHRREEEGWRVRKDGSRFYASVLVTELHDESGHPRGFAKIMQDITQSKKAFWLESDRRLLLQMVAEDQPLANILDGLVRMIERQRPTLIGSVMLLNNNRVWHGAAPNLSAEFFTAIDGATIGGAAGAFGAACFRGQSVISVDIGVDPLWEPYRELALKHRLRACWAFPIQTSTGQVLGALAMYCAQAIAPDSSDLELMETASKLAAIAIEHQQLKDQLAFQAHHDSLTSLPNRVLFEDRLRQALATVRRSGEKCGVLFIDVDRFKLINDTLGHAAGDSLLQQVATRLRSCLREVDTLARTGGDEFTVVLPGLTNAGDASWVATRILQSLETPFDIAGHSLVSAVSIGISIYPDDGAHPAELLRNADISMYHAKSQGGNRMANFVPDQSQAALDRLGLEADLRRALEGNQFELHYQPRVSASGRILGVEALLRWNHPQRGMVSPEKFIPLAEENGLIVSIGAWALRQACHQNRMWRDKGLRPITVAVNVSTMQFAQTDFVDLVARTLSDTGLDPRALEIEITESLLMHDAAEVATRLGAIRKLGVGIAIDDFGTGYSSLRYLQMLPIDTVKIDRSFVKDLTPAACLSEGAETAIVRTIASLGRSLKMHVVAEGVEQEHQRDFLMRIGCDAMQGYLFGKPVGAGEIERMLRTAQVGVA